MVQRSTAWRTDGAPWRIAFPVPVYAITSARQQRPGGDAGDRRRDRRAQIDLATRAGRAPRRAAAPGSELAHRRARRARVAPVASVAAGRSSPRGGRRAREITSRASRRGGAGRRASCRCTRPNASTGRAEVGPADAGSLEAEAGRKGPHRDLGNASPGDARDLALVLEQIEIRPQRIEPPPELRPSTTGSPRPSASDRQSEARAGASGTPLEGASHGGAATSRRRDDHPAGERQVEENVAKPAARSPADRRVAPAPRSGARTSFRTTGADGGPNARGADALLATAAQGRST